MRAGEERLCKLTLSGGVREPVVEMVSVTGEVIGAIRLNPPTDEVGADDFIGTCRIPKQPFRVRVRGQDRDGHPFQRITAALNSPLL